MNVKKQIELDNQQPIPDEGQVHRLFLREVQNQLDKLILETAVTTENFIFYGIKDNSGLRYIGITKHNIQKRFREHISRAKYYHKKCHRDWWILKCLNNDIKLEIFEFFKYQVDLSTAKKIEDLMIETFIKKGFGLTNSTSINFKASEKLLDKKHFEKPIVLLTLKGDFFKEFESCKLCAEYLKCNNSQISNVLKKKKNSVRNYLCIYKDEYNPEFKYEYKKYLYDKSPMKNVETKKKILLKNRVVNCKPIQRISISGEIKNYDCISDALVDLGKPRNYGSNIIKHLNGKRTHAFNYKWKYL